MMGVSVNHLTIRIGGAPIVSDVHIDVRDGQRVGLILSLIHISEPTRPY